MKHAQLLVTLLGATALFAGCSSTPTNTQTGATKPAPVQTAPTAATEPAAQSTVTPVTLPAYLDPNNPIAKERSVYFDFDSFAIKSDYNSLIERQGKYLAANPSLSIKVEGNTDERGSAEYNLALGQKRAAAVVSALKVYGVKDGQLEAISWGEEKPKATGHDEAAWAENRRADLDYPTK